MKVDGLHHVTAITAHIEPTSTSTAWLLGLRSAGGRVVNLIGDEVPYTARDELSACTIALNLAKILARPSRCAPARAGVAGGAVMMRDGDVFGPVVNLAARAVKLAANGEVTAPAAVAADADIRAEPQVSTARRL